MAHRKANLKKFFRPVGRDDGVFLYQCVLCGEVVEKGMRGHHLRYKHLNTWLKEVEGDENTHN